MERYIVESPHTPQECLAPSTESSQKAQESSPDTSGGPVAGDHTGYAIVEARSESEVKESIPLFLEGKARVVKLNKFTPEQIRDFHRKSA